MAHLCLHQAALRPTKHACCCHMEVEAPTSLSFIAGLCWPKINTSIIDDLNFGDTGQLFKLKQPVAIQFTKHFFYVPYPPLFSDILEWCGFMHHSLCNNACCIDVVLTNAWWYCVRLNTFTQLNQLTIRVGLPRIVKVQIFSNFSLNALTL